MTAEIHMTLPDGTDDMVLISGKDPDEIHAKACAEVIARGGKDPWSKVVSE